MSSASVKHFFRLSSVDIFRYYCSKFFIMSKERPSCPYKEKCYRKNPTHFQEMSHKHLEDILVNQLNEADINLPTQLGFESKSKDDLLEQLSVVKKVLIKLEETALKEKIEKNKLAAIEKRKQKLKESEVGAAGPSSAKKAKSHRQEMRDQAIAKMLQNGIKVPEYDPGGFASKYVKSAPYHYFFSRVENSKVTFGQQFSVTFTELLDESLGEIVDSLHINFMVDVGWLCAQYILAVQNPKMTIAYGSLVDEVKNAPKNITLVPISMPNSYGCHHSKISVLKYNHGFRIIVSTANLYTDDWENRTQGIWMSPHLPQLPDGSNVTDGESSTGFKKDFRQYLLAYSHPKIKEWEKLLRMADFSSVNVFFVASVPGAHKGAAIDYWGCRRLAQILAQHATLPSDGSSWKVVAQASSIGSLGANFESWISSTLVAAMIKEKTKGIKSTPEFKFVYPTLKNYEASFDCREGSSCFPYSRTTHEKQKWLNNYLYQWKSENAGRTKAMPHIKSYTRISPNDTKIPWFVLTSANLSKGAWGSTAKTGLSHFILNYEAGVVFIPKIMVNKDYFPIKKSDVPDVPTFRLPYDLPLIRYAASDVPFVNEFLRE